MMQSFITLKKILISIVFYPLFIVPYFVYVFIHKLSWLVQYLFTVMYIEKICGYKRRQKIIQAINSLTKLPQNVILAFTLTKYQLQSQHNSQQKVIENILVQDYIHILNQINSLQSITVYVESQSELMDGLAEKIRSRIQQIKSNKIISVVDQAQRHQQYTQKLVLPENNSAPLMIVFSNYESTCHIPSKYLINTEIAFNQPLMVSTKYDLYRSFCQYAHSKQRNGK